MNFKVVIDISSIIWDPIDYDNNSYHYYGLTQSLLTLIEKLKKEQPYILLRTELLTEMVNEFPYNRMPEHFQALGHTVYSFLGNIRADKRILYDGVDRNVNSIPDLIKPYFNAATQNETKYLLTYIHTEREVSNVFFTFQHLWGDNINLTTFHNHQPLECNTVVSDANNSLDAYFNQFKRFFQHSNKHHAGHEPGDYVSPLSCYNGNDTTIPQHYLDTGVLEGKRYYNFDLDNDVYVVFFRTHDNIYHGHDEGNRNKIPPAIRKNFHK